MAAQDPGREKSIGFVGLGDMGGPIAHRIAAAGFPLAVWSRGVHSLKELGAQPYVAVNSLQELGNRCDIVAICVFGDADVRDVVLGPDGLLAAMSRDSVLVIHSTVSVALCWEIAVAGAERGVHVLDAPVSGARAGAVNGTLTIMVGRQLIPAGPGHSAVEIVRSTHPVDGAGGVGSEDESTQQCPGLRHRTNRLHCD